MYEYVIIAVLLLVIMAGYYFYTPASPQGTTCIIGTNGQATQCTAS